MTVEVVFYTLLGLAVIGAIAYALYQVNLRQKRMDAELTRLEQLTAEVTMNAEAVLDQVDQRVEKLNQLAAAMEARALEAVQGPALPEPAKPSLDVLVGEAQVFTAGADLEVEPVAEAEPEDQPQPAEPPAQPKRRGRKPKGQQVQGGQAPTASEAPPAPAPDGESVAEPGEAAAAEAGEAPVAGPDAAAAASTNEAPAARPKRGRPAKKGQSPAAQVAAASMPTAQPAATPSAAPKRRGRKPKAQSAHPTAGSPTPGAPASTDRYGGIREAVYARADRGEDVVAIAAALGVPRGEVMLLLNLRGKHSAG